MNDLETNIFGGETPDIVLLLGGAALIAFVRMSSAGSRWQRAYDRCRDSGGSHAKCKKIPSMVGRR